MSGVGSLTVAGDGALFLLGENNTYQGGTTVDSGATLVYRWNEGANNDSIPGGQASVALVGTGKVEPEGSYFGADTLIWDGAQTTCGAPAPATG